MSHAPDIPPRQRMPKPVRHTQLLDAARDLIRAAGTDEFSLARLAEHAGVTKPLVYDHFGDRSGVLAELYREFEHRQRETLATALQNAPQDLGVVSGVVAGAYIDCCLAEGRELADVVAALAGSATLTRLRQEAEEAYLDMCRSALEPLSGPMEPAGLLAIIGAGDALARRALDGSITAAQARSALSKVVAAVAGDAPEHDGEDHA
ncbi:TetR/AcrR family transcriptional regulator [Microbacterium sp. EST19A]|uniref:TetR/AcrR family transcriptional regulator n=1 Tax=Microbacterium sp. EST19A TaxID=2862681 RepID=UPI001CC04BF7|nr:TetR/AcrR family transcriptional regulator [Microbacterium sp. EST19A]